MTTSRISVPTLGLFKTPFFDPTDTSGRTINQPWLVFFQNMAKAINGLTPSGAASAVEVNGGAVLVLVNLNGATPSAPAGAQNVEFQIDASGNVTAYVDLPSGAGIDNQAIMINGKVVSDDFDLTFNGTRVLMNGAAIA